MEPSSVAIKVSLVPQIVLLGQRKSFAWLGPALGLSKYLALSSVLG